MSVNEEEILNAIQFVRIFTEQQGKTVDEALIRLEDMGIIPPIIEAVRERLVKLQKDAREGDALVIRGLGAAEPWYLGPTAAHQHWPAMRNLLAAKGWTSDDLRKLDSESSQVLASCRSPWIPQSSGRGLVLGHVQSGKTTNFSAVIAKAADAGFRVFIVLSGVTKTLRRQTQERLNQNLIDLDQVGTWIPLTDESRDFGELPAMPAVFRNLGLRTLIVSKKNVSRLKRLNSFLDKASKVGVLDSCPIMVIDDEGDQASLSPNCDPEKLTAINREIVRLLDRPRVSYVAYTATPFANVFVSPFYDENLYPRDFICSLEMPPDYFGPIRVFGDDVESNGIDVVRRIPSDEEDHFFGADAPSGGTSLRKSVMWFMMAATARRIRSGGVQPHTTMLINASESVEYHFNLWPIVRNLVVEVRDGVAASDSGLIDELRELWNTECTRVPAGDFGNPTQSFDQILDGLPTTVSLLGPLDGADHDANPDCSIVVDNYKAEVRLAYDDDAPRPIIVIGGNTLARGMTLEGLVASVFARSTKLYDTLLQMGRWFGYRRGYEDLPRVWMFKESIERFEFLASVEREIRVEIARYVASGMSPLDFGVRIRRHPALQITRAAFLRNVRNIRFDLSGSRPQTTFFENEASVISQAVDATNRFAIAVTKRATSRESTSSGELFRGVPMADVMSFFSPKDGYPLSDANEYFNTGPLLEYLQKKGGHGELQHWNVLFMSVGNGAIHPDLATVPMKMISRTRLKSSVGQQTICIGVLTGRDDGLLDVPPNYDKQPMGWRDESKIPLLVLYAIDKDSCPRVNASRRVDLDAVNHLIGVAAWFPLSSHDDQLGDFAVVHGPWDIRSLGDENEPPEDAVADDDEDDFAPSLDLADGG